LTEPQLDNIYSTQQEKLNLFIPRAISCCENLSKNSKSTCVIKTALNIIILIHYFFVIAPKSGKPLNPCPPIKIYRIWEILRIFDGFLLAFRRKITSF